MDEDKNNKKMVLTVNQYKRGQRIAICPRCGLFNKRKNLHSTVECPRCRTPKIKALDMEESIILITKQYELYGRKNLAELNRIKKLKDLFKSKKSENASKAI